MESVTWCVLCHIMWTMKPEANCPVLKEVSGHPVSKTRLIMISHHFIDIHCFGTDTVFQKLVLFISSHGMLHANGIYIYIWYLSDRYTLCLCMFIRNISVYHLPILLFVIILSLSWPLLLVHDLKVNKGIKKTYFLSIESHLICYIILYFGVHCDHATAWSICIRALLEYKIQSSGREIPCLLWNVEVYYCVHRTLLQYPIQFTSSHPTS